MRIAALIGEPATGKSTVAKLILQALGPARDDGIELPVGLLRGTEHVGQHFVLGLYPPGEKFGGTDRLSMAVQRDAEVFLSYLASSPKYKNLPASVFFEGDRLGNLKFLNAARNEGRLRVFVLEAGEATKSARHKERGDTQKEAFLKGRKTKIANIVKAFPYAVKLPNETEDDLLDAVKKILDFMRGGE